MAKSTAIVSKSSKASKALDPEIIVPLKEAFKSTGFKSASLKLPEPKVLKALTTTEADKNIRLIQTSGKKTQLLIHTTACGILMHYVNTGDYTPLIRLTEATREALGTAMMGRLIDWVEKYSTVKWNDKNKHYFDSVRGMGMEAKSFTLSQMNEKGEPVGAAHESFFTVEGPRGTPTTYNAFELLGKLFERLQNLMKANEEDKRRHVVGPSIIQDFKEFLEKHGLSFDDEGKLVKNKEGKILLPKPEPKVPAKKTTLIKAERPRKARAVAPVATPEDTTTTENVVH